VQIFCWRTRKTQDVKRKTQAKLRFTFHVIQREVQGPLALLRGEFAEDDTVQVEATDGHIVFDTQR
jgi:hypothetical protein